MFRFVSAYIYNYFWWTSRFRTGGCNGGCLHKAGNCSLFSKVAISTASICEFPFFYLLPTYGMTDLSHCICFNKCKMVLSVLLMCLFDIFVCFLVKVCVPKPFLFFFFKLGCIFPYYWIYIFWIRIFYQTCDLQMFSPSVSSTVEVQNFLFL